MEQERLDGFSWDETWKAEWKDMPEYEQEDMSPYKSVIVHFRNERDFKDFEKVIRQKIVKRNQKISIWFPEMKIMRRSHLRYADDES